MITRFENFKGGKVCTYCGLLCDGRVKECPVCSRKEFKKLMDNKLKLINKCWYINGGVEIVDDVINLFCDKYNLKISEDFYWLNNFKSEYKFAIKGIIFGYLGNGVYSQYYGLYNNDEKDIKSGISSFVDCEFMGELRIEFGELVIDDTIANIYKYNV